MSTYGPDPDAPGIKRLYVPTRSPEDWRPWLNKPELQWRSGYSAKTLAYAWEAAARQDRWPAEVVQLFQEAPWPICTPPELLLAVPEYQVPIPPEQASPSQSDLFVLARAEHALVVVMIEGKVAESFGPSLDQWLEDDRPGKHRRLRWLRRTLGIEGEIPGDVPYQLLHRTASAVKVAGEFCAPFAVMIVHAFGHHPERLEDYRRFLRLFGQEHQPGRLAEIGCCQGRKTFCGWAQGEEKFLQA